MLTLAEFVFLAVHLAHHLAVLTLEALGVDEAHSAIGVVRQVSHLWEPWCIPAHGFERLDWRVVLVVAAVVHADGERPQDPQAPRGASGPQGHWEDPGVLGAPGGPRSPRGIRRPKCT